MSEVKLSEIPHLPWFIRGRPLDNGLAVIENGTYEGAHIAECEWHIAHYIVDTLNNQCPAESTSVAEAVEREREACAKIADSEARPTGKPYDPYRAAAEAIAIRILNRKEGGCAVLDEIRKAKKNDF